MSQVWCAGSYHCCSIPLPRSLGPPSSRPQRPRRRPEGTLAPVDGANARLIQARLDACGCPGQGCRGPALEPIGGAGVSALTQGALKPHRGRVLHFSDWDAGDAGWQGCRHRRREQRNGRGDRAVPQRPALARVGARSAPLAVFFARRSPHPQHRSARSINSNRLKHVPRRAEPDRGHLRYDRQRS